MNKKIISTSTRLVIQYFDRNPFLQFLLSEEEWSSGWPVKHGEEKRPILRMASQSSLQPLQKAASMERNLQSLLKKARLTSLMHTVAWCNTYLLSINISTYFKLFVRCLLVSSDKYLTSVQKNFQSGGQGLTCTAAENSPRPLT